MKPRQILLAAALLVTLLAAFWPESAPLEVVAVAARPQATQAVPGKMPRLARQQESVRLGEMKANLFPAHTWAPPVLPVQHAEPPPEKALEIPLEIPQETAPPLPFQFVGRWQENGAEVVFLADGNRLLKAQLGDTLSGWQLTHITPQSLSFIWLALNQSQSLRITP